jgi:hypothetical protein
MSRCVLRVYDPAECDAAGVALDWERCRTCEGTGAVGGVITGEVLRDGEHIADLAPGRRSCPTCRGHRSLKALVLHDWSRDAWEEDHSEHAAPTFAEHVVRCEDCCHPMSEGTWEGTAGAAWRLKLVLAHLQRGLEPDARWGRVHWSPCDERCTHGGHLRFRPVKWADVSLWGREHPWVDLPDAESAQAPRQFGDYETEASWRQVDVRMLGWPHDLRPEKLAVLCLRCWASRGQA